MKELFLLIGAAASLVGLIILQLKFLRKHHPNAELLIGLLKLLKSDLEISGNYKNG
jgi:hypothetical protein